MIITDLDGTLCDTRHRDHLKAEGWDAWHSQGFKDAIYKDVETVIDYMFKNGFEINIVTGRPERYREQTLDWLDRHTVGFHSLYMRPNDNYQRSGDLKWSIFENKIWPVKPLFVLENEPAVAQHWRDNGFNCWLVRPS